MIKSKTKKEAIRRLTEHIDKYENKANLVKDESLILYQLRKDTAANTLKACEQYISELANAPREFKKSVESLELEIKNFNNSVEEIQNKVNNAATKSGGGAVAGVAGGVGVAAFAPSAAMAIATTFGTASTGTAISALSGAAASKAALAWIGGGAVAAGGGGVAGGKLILGLAGPVGWAIAGAGVASAFGYAYYKDIQTTKEANQKTIEVQKQINILERAHNEIGHTIALTRQHDEGVREQLKHLKAESSEDYNEFNEDDKLRLGALINNVNSLAELINKRIEIEEPN